MRDAFSVPIGRTDLWLAKLRASGPGGLLVRGSDTDRERSAAIYRLISTNLWGHVGDKNGRVGDGSEALTDARESSHAT